MDPYTGWSDDVSCVGKSTEVIVAAFRQFCASTDQIDNCWTDNAQELMKACHQFGYRHHPAMDNPPHSNGVVERKLRRILEGTRVGLPESSLSRRFWHLAMRFYCALHNLFDVCKY